MRAEATLMKLAGANICCMLNMTELSSLATVVEEGSVQGAARSLRYSPSTVSRHISHLESELGIQLLERGPRSIRVSAAARLLAERARNALQEVSAIYELAEQLKRRTAKNLKLNCLPAAEHSLVPQMCVHLRAHQTEVELETESTVDAQEAMAALQNGETDIAVVADPPSRLPASLCSTALLADSLMLVSTAKQITSTEKQVDSDAPSVRATLAARAVSEGTALRVITAPEPGDCPLKSEALSQWAGGVPVSAMRTTSHAQAAALVRSGLGFAVVPALGLVNLDGGLKLEQLEPGYREIHAIWRRENASPLLRAAIGALRQAAASLATPGIVPLRRSRF